MEDFFNPIGVFDSGVGGLSVWREIKRLLPGETLVYFADSAHVPYGEKSPRELTELSKKVCRFLLSKKVKLIVVACNTATAYCITKLRREFNLPFVGTVPPVKPAAVASKAGKIAVMATPATIESDYLVSLISDFAKGIKVIKIPAYELEDLIEHGDLTGGKTLKLLVKYLHPALKDGIDSLALGCTHYPFLLPKIKALTKNQVKVFDPAPGVAKQVKRIVAKFNQSAKKQYQPEISRKQDIFYTTGDPKKFSQVAQKLLGIKVKTIQVRL